MSLSLSLLLLALGLLLATWSSKDGEKNPLVALAGLGLVGVALLLYLTSGLGVAGILRSLFVDAGLALVAVAMILGLRGRGGRPFFLLGLFTLGIGVLLAFALRFTGVAGTDATTSFLLELGPDDRIAEVRPLLERHGARAEPAFPSVELADDENLAQYFLVFVHRRHRDGLMELLAGDAENVDFVESNETVVVPPWIDGTPAPAAGRVVTDDPLAARQWGLAAIEAHDAHVLLRDLAPRKRAVVAVLDTGVDGAHEDLRDVLRPGSGTHDAHGHGTHCAGIAGAATNNGRGIASLNWDGRFVEVVSFQALPHGGAGTFESIAQAIIDAAQADVDVISMSLGLAAASPPRVLAEAVGYARRRGVIVVASAGNAGEDALHHTPSNIDGVIAVAAVDASLRRARFSNTTAGLKRPIAAPGVDILSLKPDGVYAALSGTSMAAPMVAGLLGVLRAIDPELSADEAYTLLVRTGQTVEDTPLVGRVIDAEAAVRALAERSR